MDDDKLREHLRELPVPRASANFTGDVLRRIQLAPGKRRHRGVVFAAGITVVVAAFLLGRASSGLSGEPESPEPKETAASPAAANAASLAKLNAELQSLRRDVRQLQTQSRPELRDGGKAGRLVPVGNRNGLDYVFDLDDIGKLPEVGSQFADTVVIGGESI